MFFSHLMIYSTAKIRQVFGTTKLLEQKVIAHQDNDRAVMQAYGFDVIPDYPKVTKKQGEPRGLGNQKYVSTAKRNWSINICLKAYRLFCS